MTDAQSDVRLAAVRTMTALVQRGKSLGETLPAAQLELQQRDAALLQQLVFGVSRWSWRLDALLQTLVKKPLRAKDTDVKMILWCALFEITDMRTPDYAAVNSYAALTGKLRKQWARSLVNGTLRSFLRQQEALCEQVAAQGPGRYALPPWLEKTLRLDWPEQAAEIFDAGNRQAPLVLRINQRAGTRSEYLEALQAADAPATIAELGQHSIALADNRRVEALPGFADGLVSVQDSAAQLAAELLDPQPGEYVLDACAAPGGKTCHLLEHRVDCEVLALDSSAKRLALVEENLERLGLQAAISCADAAAPDDWWDGRCFDAILLDAPCSALGVLRRHPDIRLLRRQSDIDGLVEQQRKILQGLWPLLKAGGRLLYATCSLLKRENEEQISFFLDAQTDATEEPLFCEWGLQRPHGRQILTGQHNADGFYYALLRKAPAAG